MSSEQPLDPRLIEQTKQQIRSLVAEIAQFSKTDSTPDEFYAEFLPRVVSALAAVGGVVWAVEDQGRLGLKYQVNLRESRLADCNEEDQARHGRLLSRVMSTGEGILVPPHSGSGEEDQAANPTDHLLVLGPLKTELEVVGVVEVFQRPDAGPTTQKGYLRFLLQMCDLAADFLKSRQLRHFSDRQVLWAQLEEFTRLVHASLNPRDTAYTIANEGRRLIECDRVSVAIRKGGRCVIEAVSGQDLFDKRSNTVRLLGKLASVVTAGGEPVWYTGDASNLAPQVEEAVQEYVDETHSKTVAVLPLARPAVEKDKERADDPNEVPPAIGALIVEQIEDSRVPAKMIQRVEVVGRHSAVAMANALEHENLFLMPVWRTLGKARWLTEARRLPKVIAVGVLITALIAALIFVPADFRPHSTGTLEPVDQRNVFAQTPGEAVEVLVGHRQVVERDQLMVRLRNHSLNQQAMDLEGKCKATSEEIRKVRRQLVDMRQMSREDESRLQGEMTKLTADFKSYERQLQVLYRQIQSLEVRSPIKGEVISWDLERNLLNRPVQPGQILVKLADPEGPWRLELRVPEDRMGYLQSAQNAAYETIRRKLRPALADALRDRVTVALIEEVKRGGPVAPANEQPVAPKTEDPKSDEPKTSEPKASETPLFEPRGPVEPKPVEAKPKEAAPSEGSAPPPAPPSSVPAPPPSSLPGPQDMLKPGRLPSDAAPEAPAPVDSPATPSGDAAATEETSPKVEEKPSLLDGLDASIASQVKELLPKRLEEAVEAELQKIPKEKLREKLRELTGEDVEDRLAVDFCLESNPGRSHRGFIYEIGRTADIRGEEGNTVLVKVAIDKEDIDPVNRHQGVSVSAKVACGRRSLGFVLFHDLFAWVRKMAFRWL